MCSKSTISIKVITLFLMCGVLQYSALLIKPEPAQRSGRLRYYDKLCPPYTQSARNRPLYHSSRNFGENVNLFYRTFRPLAPLTSNNSTATGTLPSNSPLEEDSNDIEKETARKSLLHSQLVDSFARFDPSIGNEPATMPKDANTAKELQALKARLERLEKSVSTGVLSPSITGLKSKNTVDKFTDAVTAPTIQINARTVEIFSILSFFAIGAVLGASLLDRLWLLGGIVGAWWASGAVQRNTRGGSLDRKSVV